MITASFWNMCVSTGRVIAVILIVAERNIFSLISRNELDEIKLGHTTAQHVQGQAITLG